MNSSCLGERSFNRWLLRSTRQKSTSFLCAISRCLCRHRAVEPLPYMRQGACLYIVLEHEANMWRLLFIGLSPVSKCVPWSRTLFVLHWHFGLGTVSKSLRADDIYDLSPNVHRGTWCNSHSFVTSYRYYNTLLFMCTPDRVVSNPFISFASEVCLWRE